MNSIVIADDHPLLLRGLSDFLTSKGFNIIGVAEDGQSAYNLIVKLKPDIAILDIRMPHKTGLEIAEDCQKNKLSTKIILITFDQEEELYEQARSLNVYGYILKELAIEEIEICIQHLLKNEPYFSKEIESHLKKSTSSDDALNILTKTEKKVIKLIAANKTSQEIAEELSVSIKTIHKHRSHIIAKLKLDNKPMSLSVWANLNKEQF
ncbi:response regulator [Yeosuana marina]|uniref:response regulator n=1 Tax=Yeosuana marina TaxID=1565536 RepID=UPI001420BC2F|nr:response regulator transcription factor [Yeosuana marina]